MVTGGIGLARATQPGTLPTIRLGGKQVSRLIVGNNPLQGFSHTSKRLNQLMTSYFTHERCVDFVLHCEKQGIDTWQTVTGDKFRKVMRAVRERGSGMQFILLSDKTAFTGFDDPADPKPIAIVAQGVMVDRMMRTGRHGEIHDYVKKIHDAGFLAGVSTHDPDHLARIDDYGWENDFFMACFYNIYRPAEEIARKLADTPVGETYLVSEPARMTARIRQVRRPCLGYKILAAGRVCESRAAVERAFQFAYANIKPSDAAIVGFYPVLHDEVAEGCEFARRFA